MAKRSTLHLLLLVLALDFNLQGSASMVEASISPPFPGLIILGDSTVDVGTNNYLATVIRADFPPYGRDLTIELSKGRFCNGLLVPDYLAQDLGLPLPISYQDRAGQQDKLLQGVNFASSGSGWLNLTADLYNVLSFSKQVDQFKDYKKELIAMVGQSKAEYIISNALYLISTGANDYVLNYYLNPVLQAQYSIREFQALIKEHAVGFLKDLYDSGARNIAVASLPAIGCVPAAISLYGYRGLGEGGCVNDINKAALSFNDMFETKVLPSLRAQFKGSKIVVISGYRFLLELFADPSARGYKQTRIACCGTGTVEVAILCNPETYGTCANADGYVFFDSFHPTTRVYKQVNEELVYPVLKAAFKF